MVLDKFSRKLAWNNVNKSQTHIKWNIFNDRFFMEIYYVQDKKL